MLRIRGTALGAALALMLAVPTARAAVSTAKVTEAGAGPYRFGYILAQDAASMTLVIHKADGTSVATIPVSDPSALTKGVHDAATSPVVWDGKIGGNPAPAGDYYGVIQTTGAPVAEWTLLTPPTKMTPPAGKPQATNVYGGEANINPNSVFHNAAFWGITDTPAGQSFNGIEITWPDGSSAPLFVDPASTGFDYVAATVMANDNVVGGTQLTKKFPVVDPATGTLATTYAAGKVDTRKLQAFGAGDTARIYFINDNPSENGIALLDPVTAAGYTTIIPQSDIDAASGTANLPRSFVVSKDEKTIFITGVGYIVKFTKTDFGWSNDFAFSAPDPTGNIRGSALSPDGNTLYVTNNGGNQTLDRVLAYDANAANAGPVSQFSFYNADPALNIVFTPQGIATTSSGNVYVTGGITYTTTTANGIALLAPPDNGSTDSTRSPLFPVTATAQNITLSGLAEAVTFHGATVTWNTNAPANSVVKYGTSAGNLDQTVSDDSLAANHSVALEGLASNTTYYYQVTSGAPGYNPGVSTVRSFKTTTLTVSTPVVPAVSLGSTTAEVTWTTNEPSTSTVRYGVASGVYDTMVTDNAPVTSHSVRLTGLTPGATYYYQVESGWSGSPGVASAEQSFTTPVFNLITREGLSVTKTSATLTFSTQDPATATVKFGTSTGALNGTATVTGGGTTSFSAVLGGLAPGTTYYYSISLNGASVAERGAAVGVFATPTDPGATSTVVHSNASSITAGKISNLVVGGPAGLLSLPKQGMPGDPVIGPDLPVENYYSGVAAHNGYVYVVGGTNASGVDQNTVYYCPIAADGTLDAATGWKATTSLPGVRARIGGMVFGYNKTLYVVGGYSGAYVNTVLYAPINADGSLGAWKNGPDLPAVRGLGTATAADGYVLVSGGFDVDAVTTNFMSQIRPDGSLGPWYRTTPLGNKRNFHRTLTNAHTAYSVSDFTRTDTAWAPILPTGDLGVFTQGGEQSTRQFAMAAGILGGKIVAAGGRDAANTPLDAVQYISIMPDGGLDFAWTPANILYPAAVADVDGAAYNNRLYVAGGRTVFSGTAPAPVKTTVTIPMVDDIFALTPYAYNGSVESPVIDLGAPANLANFKVAGTGVSASSVKVRYRFANAASGGADPVFSDWFDLSGIDAAISGLARYFQYELVLSGDGSGTPVVSSITLTTTAASVAPKQGDVDKNGQVQRADVALALKIAGGLIAANDPTVSFQNADYNGDGKVDVADATAIARVAQP